MAVYLENLYEEIRKQEEIQLVAGEKGLQSVVKWVHMVEGEEIASFLEGQEIAFTTGIALQSDQELIDLVKKTRQSGASGMAINVGPYIKAIPEEVIAYGNRENFPIFQVPWKVHMANIMRYFTIEINKDEQMQLELGVAIKNAVYLPKQPELYEPALLNNGFKKEWSYGCCLFQLFEKGHIPVEEEKLSRMVTFIQNHYDFMKKKVIVAELEENIAILYTNTTEEAMAEEGEAIWKKLKEYYMTNGGAYVGIGRCASRIREIEKTYRQAGQVLKLQMQRGQKNTFQTYSSLGMYKLLLSIENKEIMKEYYDETLRVLERYDRANETDYLYFLKEFFDLGASVQATADALHMHRNSVTYKIHKVEEILGMEIGSIENRTRIQVAFMIRELL